MNIHIKTCIILLTLHAFGYAADGHKKPMPVAMDRTTVSVPDPSVLAAQERAACGKLVVNATATCCVCCFVSVAHCIYPCNLSDTEKANKNK